MKKKLVSLTLLCLLIYAFSFSVPKTYADDYSAPAEPREIVGWIIIIALIVFLIAYLIHKSGAELEKTHRF